MHRIWLANTVYSVLHFICCYGLIIYKLLLVNSRKNGLRFHEPNQVSTSYILTSVWRAPISPLQTSSIIICVLWVLNLFWSKSMFTWHAKFTDEACAIRKRRRWRRRPPDYLVRNCTLERLYSLYPRIQSGSAVHVLVSCYMWFGGHWTPFYKKETHLAAHVCTWEQLRRLAVTQIVTIVYPIPCCKLLP